MEIHYVLSDVEAEFLNIICLSFRPQMVNLTIPSTYSIFIVFSVMWVIQDKKKFILFLSSLIHCSVLKYEFCIRYSLSMGLTWTMFGRRLSDGGGGCGACISRFWSDSVSDPPSSNCSKLVLSSSEISELQKLSPECVGYVSANRSIISWLVLLFIEVILFGSMYFVSSIICWLTVSILSNNIARALEKNSGPTWPTYVVQPGEVWEVWMRILVMPLLLERISFALFGHCCFFSFSTQCLHCRQKTEHRKML